MSEPPSPPPHPANPNTDDTSSDLLYALTATWYTIGVGETGTFSLFTISLFLLGGPLAFYWLFRFRWLEWLAFMPRLLCRTWNPLVWFMGLLFWMTTPFTSIAVTEVMLLFKFTFSPTLTRYAQGTGFLEWPDRLMGRCCCIRSKFVSKHEAKLREKHVGEEDVDSILSRRSENWGLLSEALFECIPQLALVLANTILLRVPVTGLFYVTVLSTLLSLAWELLPFLYWAIKKRSLSAPLDMDVHAPLLAWLLFKCCGRSSASNHGAQGDEGASNAVVVGKSDGDSLLP